MKEADKIEQVKTFAECKEKGRCAFVPYVTAGYPTMDSTVPLMMALQEGGADVIEVSCVVV